MFDFIAAQHQEWATLIDWCRSNSSGPVAIGGSSLGAQSAKAIAMNASNWHERLQADALLVITHSQHMAEAALDGALSDIWNFGDALRAAGWNQELEKNWLRRLDPAQSACMKGEHMVTVCGTEDTVTPIQSASTQMDAWNVPAENRFTYKRGHFSTPLGMINNNEAILRFAAIIKKIG